MKSLFLAVLLAAGISTNSSASNTSTPVTIKQVCITAYDHGLKKDVKKCRKTKIHKKRTGNTVPNS